FFSQNSYLEYIQYPTSSSSSSFIEQGINIIKKKKGSCCSLICTDFIVEIYYHAGVFLPVELNPNESIVKLSRIYPCDFYSLCEDLPLNGLEWTFGSEYKLE